MKIAPSAAPPHRDMGPGFTHTETDCTCFLYSAPAAPDAMEVARNLVSEIKCITPGSEEWTRHIRNIAAALTSSRAAGRAEGERAGMDLAIAVCDELDKLYQMAAVNPRGKPVVSSVIEELKRHIRERRAISGGGA